MKGRADEGRRGKGENLDLREGKRMRREKRGGDMSGGGKGRRK